MPEQAVEASLQEHLGRYRFARDQVRGRILDVACGTGYGTAMLGAVGADLSIDALRYARERYPAPYVAADALRLPFPDGAFDAVVSFETIEHVADPTAFVAELRRVLRAGGTFIVSTPNRALWSPRSPEPAQRHHVKEFTRREFASMLRPFAGEVYGQLVMSRRAAALFEGRQLAKRVVRAFWPVRRFRRVASKRLDELAPDPAYDVRRIPSGHTAAIFVAVGQK